MADPLELLPHVQFADTLQIAYLASKVQAAGLSPYDQQFVIDYLPKLMVSGRPKLAQKLGQRPQPKMYLHWGPGDLTKALEYFEQVSAALLIYANNNRLPSKAELLLQLRGLLADGPGGHADPIVEKTFNALRKISEAREGILQEATQ